MSDRGPDRCGCGDPATQPIHNAPLLPALRYRTGTHGEFLRRLLAALPRTAGGVADSRPLAAHAARDTGDATVALLDASAVVADILAFYSERIANEAYLRTATERRSVLELARAIGYELGPGVAASVHLAFTLDEAPGAPAATQLPRGTQVQSVPPQGKLPQVFETSADFTARVEWNRLRPLRHRPAELAIIGTADGDALHLLGPGGSYPADTPGLLTGVGPDALFRLDAEPHASDVVDAVPVRRIYLSGEAAGIAIGDILLFVGRRGGETRPLVLRSTDVEDEVATQRIRVDLEPLGTVEAPAPAPTALLRVPHRVAPLLSFALLQPAPVLLNQASLGSTLLTQNWRERDLSALMQISGWKRASVARAANRATPPPAPDPGAGAFAFRERVGFFGHNAPRWETLPGTGTRGDAYPKPWDTRVGSPSLDMPRSVWTDSQGDPVLSDQDAVYLERAVKSAVAGSWAVFENPHAPPRAYRIRLARDASRADFGISGRAMLMTLATPAGGVLGDDDRPDAFAFRNTTAHVGSQRLPLAPLPITGPVAEGTRQIELDSLVLGLAAGQPVALVGERVDLPGVDAAEIAFLEEVVHARGRTTLLLRDGLRHGYDRDRLHINANVVHATHGESVTEVLGSGDGAAANQRFPLKKPPLTFVSAPTPRGVRTTLEVRVNRVAWEELPSLLDADAGDEAYIVRLDDEGGVHVIMGDGRHGSRVPTGASNVTATYRSGIGPDGEVEAGTLTLLRSIPLGVRGVTNPLPATGAEGPEQLDDARTHAPLTVLTFDRVVSLLDYEDYASSYPGIGQARADRLWVEGRHVVHVTVAGATGEEPGAEVVENLRSSLRLAGDRSQRFVVAPFRLRYFDVRAGIVVDPRYVAADVLDAVRDRLRLAFAFGARRFGQPVTPAEVIAEASAVAGVRAVDLDALADTAAPPADGADGAWIEPLPARGARWDGGTRTFEPAELLLVNPAGIDLEELTP